jgi:dUTPase
MEYINRNTPLYSFAVTKEVEELCPITLDGKELNSSNWVPTRARSKDTGYDVRCAEPNGLELVPGAFFKMRLGFRMFAPDGWWLSLAPRSGTFINSNIHALYGIIDETYENEMTFVGQYNPCTSKLLPSGQKIIIAFGQRIAQVVPSPRWEMPTETISNEEIESKYKIRNDNRGTGGYGSSGQA